MINEYLQDQASLYAAGTMTAPEREQFELVLEFHDELRTFVNELSEVGVAVMLSTHRLTDITPAAELKTRLLSLMTNRPQQTKAVGMVMSDPQGLVRWVNASFSEMCGYSLDELEGKKLGPILQGEKTDPATAARMRDAVREIRPCKESILNYRKDGEPYWVEVEITPILDGTGQPLWLVARERELQDPVAA